MREVKYHPRARAELFRAARYYNRQRPGLGAEFFDELDAAVARLGADPTRAKADNDGVRSGRLRRIPFRIYYVCDPNRIRLLAVAHLRRQTGYWRTRLKD